jgi:hypothetical protein
MRTVTRTSLRSKLIHRIGEIVFEYCTSDPGKNLDSLWMEDRRNQGPNPFYNQTKQGIFLEMYYGLPSSLWTPWGKWSIGGSGCGNFNEVNEKIFERLGAQLHIRQQDTNMGTYGPVYRLTKVDDIELPVAEVEHHSKFAEYEEVKIAWKNMEIDTQNVDIEKRNMGGVNDEVRAS